MGKPSSLAPWKKRETENEYRLCQEQSSVKVIRNPNNKSLKKLLSIFCEQAEYGDTKYSSLLKGIKTYVLSTNYTTKLVITKNVTANLQILKKRNRAIQRYIDALEQGHVTTVKRKAGCPSSNTFEVENEVRQLRSQSIQYNKDIRIICQSPSGTTHRVETLETEKLMFSVANKISNKDFFLRLNFILNPEYGVANDVRYHLPCWVKATKEAQRIERVVTTDKENIGKMLSDMEILICRCNKQLT